MTIHFCNSLSGKLEEFKPIREGEVKMYTCGPTVYDFAHIGNFRAFIFEDLLRRFLEFKGFKVKHVMNITDVDDKTIAGANREVGAIHESPLQSLHQFTEKYTQAFREDLKTLNILPPNYPRESPRATREIPAMIELIQKLVGKDAAYVSDGSVYYRVSAFKDYGKLSKKKLTGNLKGARVDVDEYDKEEGADFVLWKRAKEGEPSWDSPWGKGRPGWHIECSAMSMKYLGETFDIHAGGEDLIFPHHENEIAQSEAATGKKFVHYWLHCKHLLVNGEKMSKSKGNFYTLRDLLAKGYDPMAIRYVLISVHYRQQLNFTLEGLTASKNTIEYFEMFHKSITDHVSLGRKFAAQDGLKETIKKARTGLLDALGDDLNISKALAVFFSFAKANEAKIRQGEISKSDWQDLLQLIDGFVGNILGIHVGKPIPEKIQEKVKLREGLRKEKKYEEADKIRREVESEGFITWDEPGGTTGIASK